MKRPREILVVAVAAMAASPALGGDDEWEKPFLRVLPPPARGVSVNPPDEGAESPMKRAGSFLFDAATGKPLPGATLTLYAEDEAAGVTSYDAKLASAAADESGLAAFALPEYWMDAHWIAEAPGRAPVYAYGKRPPVHIGLRKGTDATIRLLDPLGRPVEGVAVDAFPGCSHSPTLRTATSGKDGTFTLPSLASTVHSFCAVVPAGRWRVIPGNRSLGRRIPDHVVTHGAPARGRFVDAKGVPVAGVVVRDLDFGRAPVAVSDADGRFELRGLPPGSALRYLAPGARFDHVAEPDFAAAQFTLTLDADGLVRTPDSDARVRLRVSAGGRLIDDAMLRLTRTSDRWSFTTTTSDEDGEPAGTALADLPAGTYEVVPATPFEPATFAASRLVVGPGALTELTITAAEQPRLVIRGEIPEDAVVSLATESGERGCDAEPADWRPFVPATGAAVLRVQPVHDMAAVFFFPLGAEAGGTRTADVVVPAPHRVRVHGAGEMNVVAFTCDGVDVGHAVTGSTISTYAEGPIVLDAKVAGERRRFAFVIAPGAGGEVLVEATKGTPVPGARAVKVTCALADGTVPESIDSVVVHGRESVTSERDTAFESQAPCRVILRLDGHQGFDRYFPDPVTTALTWGRSSLRLTVKDEAAAPAPSIVLVDDVLHWTAEGVLELAGLQPGPHRIVVSPIRDDLAGRELRIVLADGEKRDRAVVVPKR